MSYPPMSVPRSATQKPAQSHHIAQFAPGCLCMWFSRSRAAAGAAGKAVPAVPARHLLYLEETGPCEAAPSRVKARGEGRKGNTGVREFDANQELNIQY